MLKSVCRFVHWKMNTFPELQQMMLEFRFFFRKCFQLNASQKKTHSHLDTKCWLKWAYGQWKCHFSCGSTLSVSRSSSSMVLIFNAAKRIPDTWLDTLCRRWASYSDTHSWTLQHWMLNVLCGCVEPPQNHIISVSIYMRYLYLSFNAGYGQHITKNGNLFEVVL